MSNIPFGMRACKERAVAHMALHGWTPVYGGLGTVGFWNHDTNTGVGVFYRATINDPDGDNVGEVTALGQKFRALVDIDDMPSDILEKIAKYTKVPPL